ncbi:hypothetical protein [uncultured Hyphomonas sp.]|uniref:hypothetical protein n=1 Tax=uncultured Hyphomonas sp. TaxID=225298 RepID=UPI0030D9AAC1|tara:strand:- start:25090 stop:25299 length:210 start_codon:yes stop_codon:yes gene_type:complete
MSSPSYSEEDIERAMGTVAWIIDLYGDAYWPIFERLEDELRTRQTRHAKLRKYAQSKRNKLVSGRRRTN